MEDMHGAGPPKDIDRLHKKLGVKVKLKEWTVTSDGDTYMHLKSEHELRPGCVVIGPDGEYLEAVLARRRLHQAVTSRSEDQTKLIQYWTWTRL